MLVGMVLITGHAIVGTRRHHAVLAMAIVLGAVLPQCSSSGSLPDPAEVAPSTAAPPAAPADPVGDAEIYEINLPESTLVSWERVTISLTHVTIEPGTEAAWDGSIGACCPGPKIKHILGGRLAVVSEEPMEVIRAGSSPETVAPGIEITLEAGDTVVTRNEGTDTWTNPGPQAVDLLSTPVLSARPPGPPLPPEWLGGVQEVDVREGMSLPPTAHTLRLRRVSVTGDSVLASPPGAHQLAIILDPPRFFMRFISDESVTFSAEPGASAVVYLLTVTSD